jgi:hypothetical protein
MATASAALAVLLIWVVLLVISPAFAASPDTPQAGGPPVLDAEAQEAELAMQLQNPVADLISVPVQNNWDFGIGPARAMRYTANVQPVISFSDEALGSGKFSLGPTAVVLQQQDGWTYGALVNHVWSVAGKSSRADVSATFLQPFLSYTTTTHTTFGVNTESIYDWEQHQWTVPLNAAISQLLKVGTQPVSLGIGARYYADKPAGGPDWGVRFIVTLLFAK